MPGVESWRQSKELPDKSLCSLVLSHVLPDFVRAIYSPFNSDHFNIPICTVTLRLGGGGEGWGGLGVEHK